MQLGICKGDFPGAGDVHLLCQHSFGTETAVSLWINCKSVLQDRTKWIMPLIPSKHIPHGEAG